MRKIYSLLVAFIATLTSLPAFAEVGDVVTSLDQLSNDKVYALKCTRSAIYAGDDQVIAGGTAQDLTDTKQHFALYLHNGTYFMWSVSQEKYVVQSGTNLVYTEIGPANSIKEFITAQKVTNAWVLHFTTDNYFNIGGSKQVIVDDWSDHDDGNQFTITEAGDLTADQKAKIEANIDYDMTYHTATANILSTYKDQQDGFWCNATDYETLQAAYTTYGTTYDTEAHDALKTAYEAFVATVCPGIQDGQRVAFYNLQHSCYLYVTEGNAIGHDAAYDSPRYIWTIKRTTENGNILFKLYNEYSGKYLGATPANFNKAFPVADTEADAPAFSIIPNDKTVDGVTTTYASIVDQSFSDQTYNAIHGVNWGTVVRWESNSDASRWTIKTDFTDAFSSWTEALYAKASKKLAGKLLSEYASTADVETAYTALQAATAEDYITLYRGLDNAIADLTLAAFKVYVPDNGHFVLQNKLNTAYHPYANDAAIGKNGTAYDSPAYVWTAKYNDDGTVKLFNEYAGKYLGPLPSQDETSVPMTEEETEAGNYTLAIYDDDYVNIIDYSCSSSSHNALHSVTSARELVRWTTAGNASHWTFKTDLDADYAAWTEAAADRFGTNVGDYQETSDVTEAYNFLKACDNPDKYTALYKSFENTLTTLVEPIANHYYTITVARKDALLGKVLAEGYADTESTDGNSAVVYEDVPANVVPTFWKFQPIEGTEEYQIVSANTGKCWSKLTDTSYAIRVLATDDADAGKYSYTDKSSVDVKHAVSLKESTGASLASCDGASHVVAYDGGNDGSANNFFVKEVTTIPVTIDANGYATATLPCAVTLPEGLKAYTGTKGTSNVALTELTGTVPANTPVLLEGTAETSYDLTIVYGDETAAPEGNDFKGVLAPAEADATIYVLQNGDSGMGFYTTTETTVPANSIYLVDTESTPCFTIGDGTPDGINALTPAAAKSNTYYDLNGRRVLYPTKGIYVTANGQKVFIK